MIKLSIFVLNMERSSSISGNNFILASGSHAIDLLKGVERLVGRSGKYEFSPDFVLLPMTFGDYVHAVNPNLYNN